MTRELTVGLVGAGMFGGEVHLRTYAQLQEFGIAPYLGRLGLEPLARELGGVAIRFVALAAHTKASAAARKVEYSKRGLSFETFHGDAPWRELLDAFPDLDLLAVATPDHLHAAPVLAALGRGAHVIVEKPMTLDAYEADSIVEASRNAGRIVGVDMHKRYDPDHLRIRDDIAVKIGRPLYGRAVLEEPLDISTKVFRAWAEKSDPFSYVGCHWTDLFIAYFGVKPVSLHAVGQKEKLRRDFGMDAFDAVQVKVQFDNGMSIDFINNWITPNEFEAQVNQESAIVGTDGSVESDTQYRGLRYTSGGIGTRTANSHFTRDVAREGGGSAFQGYGVDSLVVCVAKAMEVKFLGRTLAEIKGTYPGAEDGRLSVLIIHAAREVVRRNHGYMEEGRGAPVTATFSKEGITVHDPYAGPARIYDRPV